MELTVKEIKEKQKDLEVNITNLLNQFKNETGITIKGKVNNQYDMYQQKHYVHLEYSNPFN